MKTAFITGANRGLGKAFTDYLLTQNYIVFAGTRDISSFEKTDNLYPVELNLTDDNSLNFAYQKVSEATDSLDLLINNAGVNKDTATNNHKELVCTLKDIDRGRLLEMFNINSISPMMVVKYFQPILKSNPSFIINISSNRASFQDFMNNTYGNYGYRGSKVALNMFTQCLLFDLPDNVKTFCVHPGNMKTDMNPNGTDDPYVQAEKIFKITLNWKEEMNGRFLKFDGSYFPL